MELSDVARLDGSVADEAHVAPVAALTRLAHDLWRRSEPDVEALRLARSLDQAARSGLSVPETAALHGLSERSLRRVSDRVFGYGPKTLASIHRFQRALRLARSGRPASEAAVLAGYADQSHLARDTRRLAGTTFSALVEERHSDRNDKAPGGFAG
ncbi:MAG: helix-turn-helix domain-containing protein [Aeromicrobium sp.]|uniref:helix-turn-helix domain-containing protein n=1 Tax=Aeromicrobium sp. TaxID=1871063 RepID=UPI0039E42438